MKKRRPNYVAMLMYMSLPSYIWNNFMLQKVLF